MSDQVVLLDESKIAPLTESTGEKNTRRAFLAAAGAAGLLYTAALAYPIYRYLASPEEMALSATAITEVTLKDAQKLPLGSVLMFRFGPAPAMLIHHADGRWVGLSAVCTHLGCTVQYESQADRIHCACHGGVYNAYTGANVSGPPPKPLTLYKVAVNDAGVQVSRA
jgi:cytochrome b6-f complex iron-sulfur subunit